jgi:hypothetical protein
MSVYNPTIKLNLFLANAEPVIRLITIGGQNMFYSLQLQICYRLLLLLMLFLGRTYYLNTVSM